MMKRFSGRSNAAFFTLMVVVMIFCAIPSYAQVDETSQSTQAGSTIQGEGDDPVTLPPCLTNAVMTETGEESVPDAAPAGIPAGTDSKVSQEGHEPAPKKESSGSSTDDFKKLKVSLIPFLWLPSTRTTISVGERTFSTITTPDEMTGKINGAFAGRLEASQGHFGGFIDLLYLRLGDSQSRGRVNADGSFSSSINNFALFYRFSGTPVFDVYAGMRTYAFDLNLNIQPTILPRLLPGRTISRTLNWNDPILGGRVNAPFSKNWGFLASTDFSVGSSNSSWQADAMLDWKLSHGWSLQGGWKWLNFRYDWNRFGFDGMSVDCQNSGPIFRVQYDF